MVGMWREVRRQLFKVGSFLHLVASREELKFSGLDTVQDDPLGHLTGLQAILKQKNLSHKPFENELDTGTTP